jgi:hypothetical protein
MIEYHDPHGEPGVALRPYQLRIPDRPLTVGLLANGFFDSVEFLDFAADELARFVPVAAVRRWNKVNFSHPATDQVLDGIAAECHAALTAFGH